MDTTKNVIDTLVETQSKSVNNMVETAKQLQESIVKGDVIEKGADLYKNWFNNQKSLIDNAFGTQTAAATPQVEQITKTATDTYSELLNMQMTFAKTWMDSFKQNGATAQVTQEGYLKETARLYEKWNGLFGNLMNQATPQWSAFKPADWSKGATSFDQMINAGGAYMKMYEVWQPIMQQIQQMQKMQGNMPNVMDTEWLKKAMNPEAYKEVFDKMFGFVSADKMKNYFGEISHFTNSYQDTAKHWQEYWSSQMQHLNKSMSQPSAYNFGDAMQPLMQQMDKALEPLMRLMPEGKEKETYEEMKKVQEHFGTFWKKYTEMQYLIYTAGQKSMEKIVNEQIEKVKAGDLATPDYNAFYNQWLNTTEKTMIEVFGGEEFGKVQGEMLSVGMTIKQTLEKQMERTLAQYPVVSRTEADEMSKTIHDLRNRVRQLEKALEIGSDEEKAAAKKTVKAKV